MSKKYKEEINKIVMNDQMKKRILQNVLATNEDDYSTDTNMKAKTTILKVKKYNIKKRNMQMVAACFAMVISLGVVKNYPMLLNHASNDLVQKESAKSQDDENSDNNKVINNDPNKFNEDNDNNVINNDNGSNNVINNDNKLIDNNHSKEISDNNHKNNEGLDENNGYNKGNGYVKEESNNSSKIEQEEKDNSKGNSGPQVENEKSSQNNNDKTIESSNNSSKTNPEVEINNRENKNSTITDAKTKDGTSKLEKIPGNNTDNNEFGTLAIIEESKSYSQEYKTLDEAEKVLNLKVTPLKAMPEGLKIENISVISNEIIQVDYNNNIIFRAGKGIDNISGDYNVYQVNNIAQINGITISFKGNKSEEYNLAVWEKDGISYSISATKGIDKKRILDMIL